MKLRFNLNKDTYVLILDKRRKSQHITTIFN
ncbi:hypothetical protein Celal_3879 [Cellulophaga algicola DSM 14237]|uniref:Uncharacterized protein n=1 Tax=Cellulophaga algicola (strain DSM 14237 / IC166 / ACAM 630) TaxID=688270 RepID=E6XC71_CELAD|nr:hypothetical protein Celal_3879 [Cellulophaga algicola DSM 14237]